MAMKQSYRKQDENDCRTAPGRQHEPDLASVQVTHDGGEAYIDVSCKHCGRSGCIGLASALVESVDW
jgi:hypothetical protein